VAYIERRRCSKSVRDGKLPPVDKRLPQQPLVVPLGEAGTQPGRPWRHAQTRLPALARIRGSHHLRLCAPRGVTTAIIDYRAGHLESIDVQEGRSFTLRLRKGHRWSMASRSPRKTSATTGRTWRTTASSAPPARRATCWSTRGAEVRGAERDDPALQLVEAQPAFPARMAGASPLFIFRPAHYLRQFHKKYSAKVQKAEAEGTGKRRWSAVHNRMDNLYEGDNPDLPTLQPWHNTTRPPADRFVAVRNPYFIRVDERGRQLPYIDRFVLAIADAKLIPAKAGAGDADLQARDLNFNNYTFLKQARSRTAIARCCGGRGAGRIVALFPNLNVNDPVLRQLLRDARFRRALSLAIDRSLVNQVLYFGLPSSRTTRCSRQARSTGLNTARCGRVTTRKRRIACSTSSGLKRRGAGIRSCRRPAARDHRRDRRAKAPSRRTCSS